MWKKKAKAFVAVLLCTALLPADMQTMQPVHAAQMIENEEKSPEEDFGQEESGTSGESQEMSLSEKETEEDSQAKEQEIISEDAGETDKATETNTTEWAEKDESDSDDSQASGEEETKSEEEASQTEEETQTTEALQTEEETQTTEELQTEEATQTTEETQTEEPENQEFAAEEETHVSCSEIVINPLYENVIGKDALVSEIEKIHEQNSRQGRSAAADETQKFTSIEDAADYLRKQMVARNETVSFCIPQNMYDEDNTVSNRIVDGAVEHTEKCSGQEGDALRWGYGGYEQEISMDSVSAEITYTFLYYTTYEQEQELTWAVNKAIKSMGLDGQKDYDKILLIHDYICDSVDYENDGTQDNIRFTAYGALCKGRAVCQGYAVLFYRMCKEAGVSVRVIAGMGDGQPHAWNIAKSSMDGYYNVDCTWDGQDTKTIREWCLLNEKDFKNHVRDEAYATEEFYRTYPMAEYSYLVDRKEALELENLTYEFTAVDGSNASSQAVNGRPKVLIFYCNNDNASQQTIRSISENMDDFEGADIIAIETSQAAQAQVEQFRQDYGCDKIAFCYDEGSSHKTSKAAYIRKSDKYNNENNIYEPILFYIDGENYLQHASLYGYSQFHSAARVLTDLRQYCGYTYKGQIKPEEPGPSLTYNITYILDGGVNSSKNPDTYTSETETIILADARRIGYWFDGWYADRDFTSERVTQIEKGSIGNLILFAKWRVDNTSPREYTITYVLNGGKNSRFNPTKYTLETGTITLEDASWTGAFFEGWYKDADFTERVTEIAEDSRGDITLYAKWSYKEPEVPVMVAGNTVVMELSGEYYTETEKKILDRINEIRLEACRQGVRHPDYSDGRRLTMADYKPIQWSADLEGIARKRAAEATVAQSHTRPNGEDCFAAITVNNVYSAGECLAWNYQGMMTGIEQWYAEKSDWDNQTGAVTGHYRMMISPRYTYVGVGAFRQSGGGYYAVALEVNGFDSVANTKKNEEQGKCADLIEVLSSTVTKLEFDKKLAAYIREGDTYRLPLGMTVKGVNGSAAYYAGGNWSSSDDTVATVDKLGIVTAKSKGTARLTLTVGSQTASAEITVYGADESPVQVKAPAKTTYKAGDKLDVTGGTVTYPSGGKSVTKSITSDMVSGFDSENPGICHVTVVCDGYTAGFDTLIVGIPELEARYGQTLREIALPQNDYGVYTWADENQKIEETGALVFHAAFTPNDIKSFQALNDLEIQVTVRTSLEGGSVTFKRNRFVYNGMEQEPKVVVEAAGKALTEDTDYHISYQGDKKNTGTVNVIVEGMGYYYGSIQTQFTIQPAPLIIRAKDMSILIGEPLPAADAYQVEVQGLVAGDKLLQEPTVVCAVEDTQKAGKYPIVPMDADAGANYLISYINGTLLVAEEYVSYTVTFDVGEHGQAPEPYIGVRAGSTISKPAAPAAEGYRFGGWYHDASCTKAWDFDTDTVQSDITLYANWMHGNADDDFAVQIIPDSHYTGKACRPAFCVYDGTTLLKPNKDYGVQYFNNINVNKDGILKKGSGQGADFNDSLPYVQITGKGNYKDTVKANFNILPASIGTGTRYAAKGMTLKYTEQSVIGKKPVKPFASLKYKKALREGTDYALTLTVVNARDQSGKKMAEGTALENAIVPAGCEGEFLLTLKGMGNYSGSIQAPVYVAAKSHILKNAKITLGRNLKNMQYTGKPVELMPGTTDSEDTFTVKIGTTVLVPVRDYSIAYRSNNAVGKAEMILVGEGEYVGSKSVFFNIKGKPLAAKTIQVEGLEDKTYTGTAWTQNGVKLTYLPENAKMTYGTDYTIKYGKNVSKGTASITFCGRGAYSGELKKTFQIRPADIADSTRVTQADSMKAICVPYCKAGAKPAKEISLFNANGMPLKNGRDYTIRYQNNKAVAKPTDEKAPTVIIKGRGNYTGEITVKFAIEKSSLKRDGITVKMSAVNYQPGKSPDYAYTPSVRILDGTAALGKGKDYDIVYVKNTQADWEAYMQSLKEQSAGEGMMPGVELYAAEGGGYETDEPIRLPLPVYQNKLTKKNVIANVDVTTTVYTGTQVKPGVTIFYMGENGKMQLVEGKDYTISYGANVKSGKNKGSITIEGISPYYGGSVTVKFDILQRPIAFDRE